MPTARIKARVSLATALAFSFVFVGLVLLQPAIVQANEPSRYQREDEFYYLIACMSVNGDNAEGLHKCSCALGVIEAQLTLDQYRDAEMVLALRQAGGRNAALFRDTAPMKAIVSKFVQVQSEANRSCFGTPPPAHRPSSEQNK